MCDWETIRDLRPRASCIQALYKAHPVLKRNTSTITLIWPRKQDLCWRERSGGPVIVKRCRVEANQRKSFAESLINGGIYSSKNSVISCKLWISTADLTKSDAFKIFQMTKVLKNYQGIVDNITIWFIYLFNRNYTCYHAKNFQKSRQKLT